MTARKTSKQRVQEVAWYVCVYLRGVAAPAYVLMQSREHALATVGWLAHTYLKHAPELRKGAWLVSRQSPDNPTISQAGITPDTEVLGVYDVREILGAHAVPRVVQPYEE